GSWLLADDVGMHGTNVLCFDRWRGWGYRLQSHAALGASAGLGLAHLGIHRTNIDSILWFLRPGRRVYVAGMGMHLGFYKTLRGFFELCHAVMAAEKIGLAVVLVFSRSRVRLDIHAA